MRHLDTALVLLVLAGGGCARQKEVEVRPQTAAECRQQFQNDEVSKFLDRVTTRAAKGHWPAATVSFEVIAAKLPADKLENFIAKLAVGQNVSIETKGDFVSIDVDRSGILDQGASSLSGNLAEVCSIVAANGGRLTRWRYRLVDVSLDDGLMHSTPVP